MLEGSIKLYKGYSDGKTVEFPEGPFLVENNMIVDGAKEQIVDLLTRVPAPSSISASVSSTYDVSNFIIQGLSFSPNESAFLRCDALAALSGYVISGAGGITPTFSSLDPSDGTAWSYLPDIDNFDFTAVNSGFSGSTYKNGALKNPTLSGVTNVLSNGKFRDFSIDPNLSGTSMNSILNLVELPYWDIQSCLRYKIEESSYSSSPRCGSLARHDISSVSAISSIVSAGYAASDDGVLLARSFATRGDRDTSGAVVLSQVFNPYISELSPRVSGDASLGVVAEITAKFHSVSGGANASILVRLEDVDKGEFYNFSSTGSTVRNTWTEGVSGTPLVVGAASGVSGTLSLLVNIPNTKILNRLKVSFQFASSDSLTDILECYFWDAGVNYIDDWYYGNIAQNDSYRRILNGDYTAPALYMTASGVDPSKGPGETLLSSISYISQLFTMDPLKKYSGFLHGNLSGAASGFTHYLGALVIKKSTSNYETQGTFNYLADLRASALLEERLGDAVVASPLLSKTRPLTYPLYYEADPKPSDLCVEVSGSTSLSGMFELPLNRPTVFRAKALQNFTQPSGLSGPPMYFTVQTSGLDENGSPLYFNFNSGEWEPVSIDGVSISTLSEDAKLYTSSVSVESEYADITSSKPIDPNLLIGVVSATSSGSYDLILSVVNEDSESGFVKDLRMDSYAKEYLQDSQEYYDWTQLQSQYRWLEHPSSYSGQYAFSGSQIAYQIQTQPEASTSWASLFGLRAVACMNKSLAGVHTSDSEYQFALCNTRNQDEISDGVQVVDVVGLCDAALIASPKEITEDVMTSESYVPNPRFDIVGVPHFQYFDSVTGTVDYNGTYPGVVPISPIFGNYYKWTSPNGIMLGEGFDIGDSSFTLDVCYVYSVSDITFPTSSTEVAFGLKYQQFIQDFEGNPTTKWTAAPQLENGEVVFWDSSVEVGTQWVHVQDGSAIPRNDFTYTVMAGAGTDSSVIKTIFSTKVDMFDDRFTPGTKVRFGVSLNSFGSLSIMFLKDLEFYRISPFPPADLPAFPDPDDTTVQPASLESGGSLGQYTSHIQNAAYMSGTTSERALADGGYVPLSSVSALSVSGVAQGAGVPLNKVGVVNSDGFIYSGYNGAYGNFYLRGFGTSADSESVTYIIDVVEEDMQFLNFQGGIGAVGLWTFDADATFRKLKANGYDPSAIFDTDGGSQLYNVTEIDRNPVFKLFSKKTFRNPLPYPTGGGDIIRIEWTIKFL